MKYGIVSVTVGLNSVILNTALVRSKIYAFLLHLLVTLFIAAGTAILVFKVWYPDGLASLIGGAGLFKLILVVELCLGPLMSLVVFNPVKPRRELISDYLIIGLIQASALLYGVYSTYASRPVFSVFVVDRIELISAVELANTDLFSSTSDQFRFLSNTGPEKVCVDLPTDEKERSELLLSALGGKDVELMPKYYRSCREGEVLDAALGSHVLIDIYKSNGLIEELERIESFGEFTWLPVKSRFGSWIEIYPKSDYSRAYYADMDPYLLK